MRGDEMKGGSFERELCVLLSKWWTGETRDDIFGRSDGSGGRFTSRWKKGKGTANQAGDITFTDIEGEALIKKWSIEAKTGYGTRSKIKDESGKLVKTVQSRWDILDLLDSSQKKTVFETMWEQCDRDAKLTNRVPILIFRRNQRKICVAITSEYLYELAQFYGDPEFKIVSYHLTDFHIFILPFSEFLEWLHEFKIFIQTEEEK